MDNEETKFDLKIYKEDFDPNALFKKGFESNQFIEGSDKEDLNGFVDCCMMESGNWGSELDLFYIDLKKGRFYLVDPFYCTGEIGYHFSLKLAKICGLAEETCSNPFAVLIHEKTNYYGVEWSNDECFLGHALNGSVLFRFRGQEGYTARGLFSEARKDFEALAYTAFVNKATEFKNKTTEFENKATSYENKEDRRLDKNKIRVKSSIRQLLDSEDFFGKRCHFYSPQRYGSVFPHNPAMAKICGLTNDNSDARMYRYNGILYRGVMWLDGACFFGLNLEGSSVFVFTGNAGKELLRKVIDTKEPDFEGLWQ